MLSEYLYLSRNFHGLKNAFDSTHLRKGVGKREVQGLGHIDEDKAEGEFRDGWMEMTAEGVEKCV